ncbi:MAG: hypothetical protein ACHQ2Y_05355 [Candidatus Lutacidiplasmatales archaeon]
MREPMARSWMTPLPYFLAGIAVGIFVDRILGGPGSSTGLVSVVSAVAAAFALAGPLLQERMRQGSEKGLLLRGEQREHAVEIADTTLMPLGTAFFAPDTFQWMETAAPVCGIRTNRPGASNTPIETLPFWDAVQEHFEFDTEMKPVWSKLNELLEERSRLKAELDTEGERSLREALNSTFGGGQFLRARSYEADAPLRTYSPWEMLPRLRQQSDLGQIKMDEVKSNRGPELGQEDRTRITYGPEEWVSCRNREILDLEKFRVLYRELRNDQAFRAKLARIEELDGLIREKVQTFAWVSWAYYQRVKGSKVILGTCLLCPKPLEDT